MSALKADMTYAGTVTMSVKELDRLEVLGPALRASLAAPHGVRLVRYPDRKRRERVSELIRALRDS